MPEYTIERVVGVEDWEGNYGPMKTYTVEIAGEGRVAINQKPDTPPPSGTIAGTISENEYGKKLKKEQKFGGGGGGRSPAETKRIERMASHKVAVQIVAIAAQLGLIDQQATSEGLVKSVTGITRKLEADLDA